jgi:hypothetical protein
VPLLNDPNAINPNDFRKSLLIQNWEEKSQVGTLIPACYTSLRMSSQIYTEWANGEREFYDLEKDPYQLENAIASVSDKQKSEFSNELRNLKQGDTKPIVTFSLPDLISKNTVIT